jgi:hypothetical protein
MAGRLTRFWDIYSPRKLQTYVLILNPLKPKMYLSLIQKKIGAHAVA